ncbi:MAG: hypothetical protein PVH61_16700 [Candidatus Aminicenantes bacterium]|jgi:hypothetical protein
MTEKLLDKLKELEKKRNVILEQEVEKLLEIDTDEDIQSNPDWLEQSSKLLSYKKKKSKLWIPASVVLIICTVVAGGLWAISKSEINVSMKTVSSNIAFKLSERWSLPAPVTTGNLRIENFQALHAPELGVTFEDNSGSAQLEVSGKNIVIEKLELESNGIIEFDAGSNLLTISIKNTTVKGTFSVENISLLSTTGIKDAVIKGGKFQYPETIEFRGSGQSKVPINIIFEIESIENGKDWHFDNMKTDRVNFLKEEVSPGGDHSFISTIKQGKVKLYDVPGEEIIYKSDVVTMEHIDLRHLQISGNNDIYLFFEGKVKNLKIGPKGFEKNLAPSWLEYFYHNRRFGFFLSAVALFWSFLWGIKKTIFK